MKRRPITISGVDIQPGERVTLALPTPEIYTCAPLHIPMHVLHGKKEGPTLLVCATFYGDEVNGIAILKRLLQLSSLKSLHGTLIAIPVMNAYGLINQTRFLPDGHDLTTSFPGSEKGSFAARFAHLFSQEVLSHCTHSIMIHTGGPHIYKIPQIHYPEGDAASQALAKAFEAPIDCPWSDPTGFFLYDSQETKRPSLIYEGGEAHRTDEWTIRTGVRGLMKIMRELKMVRLKSPPKSPSHAGITIKKLQWVRASGSGLHKLHAKVGSRVIPNEPFGLITDPFGTEQKYPVTSPDAGIITAMNTHPLVYEGQGVIEIGLSDTLKGQEMPLDFSLQPDSLS